MVWELSEGDSQIWLWSSVKGTVTCGMGVE